MNTRSPEQMHVIVLFIAMAVGMVLFSFVYAFTTVELLSKKMREGFQMARAKRDSVEKLQTAKIDSLLKMWGER